MRYFMVALMIFLMPLRGWTGDAMATHMASTDVSSETRAAHAHVTSGIASFDRKSNAGQSLPGCHGPADLSSTSDEIRVGAGGSGSLTPAADSAGDDHCTACQTCHSVALTPALCSSTAGSAFPKLRDTHAATFTSAARALGQKPPIF